MTKKQTKLTRQQMAIAATGDMSAALAAGYSLSDARAAGYSLSDALAAGYSLSAVRTAGYSLSAALAAGYSLSDARAAGYSLSDALAAGYSLSDARAAGYWLSDALAAGYSLSAVRTAGYSLSAVRTAGYSLSAVRTAGYSLSDALEKTPVVDRPYSRMLEDIQAKRRVHIQSTFGPDDDPKTNLCKTAMCTAGHLVNMAGREGYALKEQFGWVLAAELIHEKSHPGWPAQNFGNIPQEWALAYIEEMAEREAAEAK